ncbi:MAG: biotin--[acetyl-CoA-carboxylase] ligase [Candidatus Omnitrophica bacterium]|nr:biotin--[acetyl-CoA-carboxylase] ligase [Candidatus Omnitrophota bacterium]
MRFRILHYDTLDSTNNLALQLARQGAQEGTVIVAQYQTQGRGRFKRRWMSPRGKGLLFSVILRPNLKASQVSLLTHVAGEAVAQVLKERFRLLSTLKKPNDVLVRGKKIAGILTEASTGGDRQVEFVVVGIGLNVSTGRKDMVRKGTSVYLEVEEKVDPRSILEAILATFAEKYGSLVKRRPEKPEFVESSLR